MRVEFKQKENKIMGVRSLHEVAMSAKYRYFEVEVIENEKNAEIYVGVIDSRENIVDQLTMWRGKGKLEDEE